MGGVHVWEVVSVWEVCMCGRWCPCGRCACVGGVRVWEVVSMWEMCMCGKCARVGAVHVEVWKCACVENVHVEVCVCACVCGGACVEVCMGEVEWRYRCCPSPAGLGLRQDCTWSWTSAGAPVHRSMLHGSHSDYHGNNRT